MRAGFGCTWVRRSMTAGHGSERVDKVFVYKMTARGPERALDLRRSGGRRVIKLQTCREGVELMAQRG